MYNVGIKFYDLQDFLQNTSEGRVEVAGQD